MDSVYAAVQEGDRVVMVQEYADGGDLFNLLQKYGGCLSERIAVQMVLDPFLRVLQVRNKINQKVCTVCWLFQEHIQMLVVKAQSLTAFCVLYDQLDFLCPAVPAHSGHHPP